MERPKPWELFIELRLAQDAENEQSREARLKSLLEPLSDEAFRECETLLAEQHAVLLETVVIRQRMLEIAERHNAVHDQLADAEWDVEEEARRVAELLYLVRETRQNRFREDEQALLATLYDDDVQALNDFAPPPPPPPPNDEEKEEDGSGSQQ